MTPTLLPALVPDPQTELTGRILGAAIEVHRTLGPGLLEHAYHACFARELGLRGLAFAQQQLVPIHYRGERIDGACRPDFLVAGEVVVEVEAVDRLLPVHEAQLLTCLRLTGKGVGLLINFHAPLLKHGIRRLRA